MQDFLVFFLLHCYDVSLLIHAWCGHALYLHIRCFDSQGKFTLIKVFFFFNLEDMVTEASCKLNTLCLTFLLCLILFCVFLSLPLFALNFLPLSLFLSTWFYSFTDNPNQLCQRTPIHRGQRQIERAPICELWSPISNRNFLLYVSTWLQVDRTSAVSVTYKHSIDPVLCFLLPQFIFLSCVNSY